MYVCVIADACVCVWLCGCACMCPCVNACATCVCTCINVYVVCVWRVLVGLCVQLYMSQSTHIFPWFTRNGCCVVLGVAPGSPG